MTHTPAPALVPAPPLVPTPHPLPTPKNPARPAFEDTARQRGPGVWGLAHSFGKGRVRGEGPAQRRSPAPRHSPAPAQPRDRGSVAIEYIGFLPILLFIALAAVQLGIAAYTASQAGSAARAAARMESLDDPPSSAEAAGSAAMSSWLSDGAKFTLDETGDQATVTVTVDIPSLIPGTGSLGSVTRSSTMPKGAETP